MTKMEFNCEQPALANSLTSWRKGHRLPFVGHINLTPPN